MLQSVSLSGDEKSVNWEDKDGGGQEEADKAPGRTYGSAANTVPPLLSLFTAFLLFSLTQIFLLSSEREEHDAEVHVSTALLSTSRLVILTQRP